MFKKIICVALSLALCAGFMGGCGKTSENSGKDSGKLSIVCTIFPEYDWVKNIVGEADCDITMLLDNGTDLHNYQPTTADMVKVSECDMFIYVGGESDKWVDDVLKTAKNKDMQVINLMDVMGNSAKEEEVKEGMQAEEESEEEEIEYDEHVWLSLKNAENFCNTISESLIEIDKDNADLYKTNCDSYVKQLVSLDVEFADAVKNAKQNILVFGDRFPFRYFVDDYKLDYFAAFVGCSAETEASFETIVFLAGKVDELGVPAIMTIENSNEKIAKSILDNTKDKSAKILTLNSMQSVTSENVSEGETYLKIMSDNLAVLKEALG